MELFVEKGFAATRAEEVAKRAGVSKGTLFLYFSSKEELFKAVVRENLSGQFTEWNAMFDCFPGTTPEMLKFCMHSWWERIGSTKASGITKLMMSEACNFPELAEFYKAEVIRPGNLLIQRMIQRGIDRGMMLPKVLKPGRSEHRDPRLRTRLAQSHHRRGCHHRVAQPIDASNQDSFLGHTEA